MAHTYTSVTKSDNTYTAVSTVTPTGVVGDTFKWSVINDEYDTWLELLVKQHWADWYLGTEEPWVDDFTSVTTPAYTYSSITK